MGTHRMLSNRKQNMGSQKKGYWRFKKKLVKKHKAMGLDKVSEIPDPELMTVHHLRKRKTNSRTNIALSGKKKRKLLKRLKHDQREDPAIMEAEDVAEGSSSRLKKAKFRDVEMKTAVGDDDEGKKESDESNTEDVEMGDT